MAWDRKREWIPYTRICSITDELDCLLHVIGIHGNSEEGVVDITTIQC